MSKIKKIPKLRFPEFSGDWEDTILGDISTKSNKKNKDELITDVFTNSAVNGIVAQKDYFNKDIANKSNLGGYYIVRNNDFVYNPRISISAPVGPLNRNKLNTGVMSPLYTVFSVNKDVVSLKFLEKYFKSSKWYRYMYTIANYGARSDRMNITSSDFFSMSTLIPGKPEQQKIDNFLSVVDNKIEQISKKQKLLGEYKKGLIQKIFSQEVRFTTDDCGNFPDWKEKKLGDIGEFKTSSVDKKIVKGQKLIHLVNYMNVYRHENIDSSAIENLMIVSANETQLNNSNLKSGDILFNPSSETPDDIGHSAVIFEDLMDTLYSYHLIRFRPKIQLDILYSHYFCNIPDVLRQLSRVATGSTRFTISIGEFLEIQINLPSLSEQVKIANFLSSINNKIEQVDKQLDKFKQFKKALLQQMFV